MKKAHTAVVTVSMAAVALGLAPQASAEFDRNSYLRCMASNAMVVGGLPLDSSTAAKIGADAYKTVGGESGSNPPAVKALAQKYKLSEPVATLIVQCAQGSNA